ncbi:serine protease [Micromonospora sp. MA102]|uniref:serine protease n=1 Tax=Micromonospora sp. MA102 TaxID=2952755 RepID=UPI0021C81641|nr:serine protease [Micromonospora sp. MA102]
MNFEPEWHARIAAAASGSGFLVDDLHVLTCAHVVGDRPDATVSFLALGRDHAVPGTVVFRGPWRPGDGEGDVAVIRLDEAVPVAPARLAPLHGVDIFDGHDLAAFGFPSGYTATGQISYFHADPQPRLAGRACQTRALDRRGFVLREGYSGSAAYVTGSYEVIGMVISADRAGPNGSGSGVILPVDELNRQWPQLAERIPLGPFGAGPYRELRDILQDVDLPDAHTLRLSVFSGPDAPPIHRRPLPSVLAVVESVAVLTTHSKERVSELVVQLLREVAKRAPHRRNDLHDWTGRHGWGIDPAVTGGSSVDTVARQAWVVVRVASTGKSRRLHTLTIWTATGPEGELDELVLDSMEVSRAKVQSLVQEKLPLAYARIPRSCETIGVEFVLPRGLLGWDVENWVAKGDPVPLGWKGPVVVRDVDWFDSAAPHEIQKRARKLGEHPGTLDTTMRWLDCASTEPEPDRFTPWLWLDDTPVALGLAGRWAAEQHVHQAVASGVPALLWRRTACDPHPEPTTTCPGSRFHRDMAERLRSLRSDQLPGQIRKLRVESGLNDDPEHCGRHVTLLWDEPRRRPVQLGVAE